MLKAISSFWHIFLNRALFAAHDYSTNLLESAKTQGNEMAQEIDDFVAQILREDVGRGDVFALLGLCHNGEARVLAKEGGILSGCAYAGALARLCGVQVQWHKHDCQSFDKGEILASVQGDVGEILKIERSFLNLLQHSSGIATLTQRFKTALGDDKILLLDTRKTRPLLRVFEKYSVRNGGGCNHRFGLDDCLMIKDTHRARLGSLKSAIERIRARCWTTPIEVESETFEQFCEAIDCGADIVMCDNMDMDTIRRCVEYRNAHAPHIRVEASGGITLENIANYRDSGIDALSVGAMIHHAHFIDMSMKMESL